jgi:hypothetical protein
MIETLAQSAPTCPGPKLPSCHCSCATYATFGRYYNMNTPPPIPSLLPVITADASRAFAKQAATVSLAAPFVGMGVNILSQQAIQGNRAAMVIVGCTAMLLIVAGFLLGIMALVQTKRYGRQGIFGKAIAGVCINGLLIGLMLISIPGLKKAAERAKEIQRERLQQQQP